MTPVIRIDDEVMAELKKNAIAAGLVFEPPNSTLRKILGLDTKRLDGEIVAKTIDVEYHNVSIGAAVERGETDTNTARLVIHAPGYQIGKKSFQAVFETRIGEGYIIYDRVKSKLQIPGSIVVLLAKDLKRRAEGRLIKLTPTTKTDSGKQRYDIYVDKWKEVEYKAERLNHCGITFIDY